MIEARVDASENKIARLANKAQKIEKPGLKKNSLAKTTSFYKGNIAYVSSTNGKRG